jgi:hypothetical protein
MHAHSYALQVAAEAKQAELESAALCIQALVRARTVRRRLQAAKNAARCVHLLRIVCVCERVCVSFEGCISLSALILGCNFLV